MDDLLSAILGKRVSRLRVALSLAVLVGYIPLFLLLYPLVNTASTVLAILPVAVVGWLFGLRAGLLAGVLSMPVDLVLFELVGTSIHARGTELFFVLGYLVTIAIGALVGWLSDLLERVRKTENQLALARDRALEAALLKSEFVVHLSHHLRTPINGILGFAEMLEGGVYGPLEAEQTETVREIVRRSEVLSRLINDLMEQAQLEAGMVKLRPGTIDVAEWVDRITLVMEDAAEEKGLALQVEVNGDMPTQIVGDSTRLRQITLYLLDNAIKFTETGSVTLRLARSDNAHWTLQVTDTGPGVPPEIQEDIFDPFRQIDSAQTWQASGSGLGLSIVKELAGLMDGIITLESQKGHGSTFTVTLPLETHGEGKE